MCIHLIQYRYFIFKSNNFHVMFGTSTLKANINPEDAVSTGSGTVFLSVLHYTHKSLLV